MSVRPSVHHTLALSENDASYYHEIITNGETSKPKKIHLEIRKGSPQARALNESGVGRIHNFQAISYHVSETVQDRTKVTVNH